MAWKYPWVKVPWSTVGLRSQTWGSVGAEPQSEDMDSYGTEELNRQDKNEYGSKVKTGQHRSKSGCCLLRQQVEGQWEAEAISQLCGVVLPIPCEGLSSVPSPAWEREKIGIQWEVEKET